MSNSKKYTWIFVAFVLLASCRASRYEFNAKNFAEQVKNDVAFLAGSKDTLDIKRVQVYKAVISEKLVEQNNVSEYRLLNSYSEKDTIPILVSRYRHEIYLFSFENEDDDKYAMLLTTTYDARNNCIGLGGAYAGVFRNRFNDSGFAISRIVNIKTSNDKPRQIKKVARGAEYELDFFADGPITTDKDSPIRFYQVIQRSKNKIAGLGKELVYTTSKVFNDPNALVFSFVEEFVMTSN